MCIYVINICLFTPCNTVQQYKIKNVHSCFISAVDNRKQRFGLVLCSVKVSDFQTRVSHTPVGIVPLLPCYLMTLPTNSPDVFTADHHSLKMAYNTLSPTLTIRSVLVNKWLKKNSREKTRSILFNIKMHVRAGTTLQLRERERERQKERY